MNNKRAWLAWLLAATLLLGGLVGCGEDDPSVLKLPDSTAAPDAVQSTPAPLTPLGDRTCVVGQETIPESTLFSFKLTEVNQDPQQGLLLKLEFANKSSERSFLVSLDYLAINGYMQDVVFAAPVEPGQAGAGEVRVNAQDLRAAGISSVDQLILYPLIYDDSVPMGTGDLVDGAFTFYPTGLSPQSVVYPVRQKTSGESVFFDNGFGTLILLDAQTDSEENLEVTGYLENKTDRFLSFVWEDVTVNGTAVSTTMDTVLAPGMRRYVKLEIPSFELTSRNIFDAREVSFRVTGTPVSGVAGSVTPLIEQQGTFRFSAASGAGTSDPEATPATGEDVTETAPPSTIVYTTPTSAHKRNARNGYVSKDEVNMRSGPGTGYKTVGKKVSINTAVTLYELQDGWWFLKCGSNYGYIRADMITQGKAPKATATAGSDSGKIYTGTITTQSTAAMRKEPDKNSKFIKEFSDGAKVTVYYKTKGKDGHTWYYVSDGKSKGYIRSDLLKVSGKVPSK